MTKGILGKKVGMTQIFTEAGEFIPVTVIEATPNVVLQVKTVETDGYEAVQVGFDDKVIKRHGQSRGPMAHGSRYHRRPGSMGPVAPNRVFKNKHLAGRMGGNRVTIQNLEVVQVIPEKNVILIKGNVPGAKKSLITIKSAVKAAK